MDVIANAYLGGEGVISLLVAGLDHLFRAMGVFDRTQERWPTVADLLAWLRTTKLRGRAALWKDSAERILLGMTYSEFGAVINCQHNGMVQGLLDHNIVLEMDGLSSDSDRRMFSEALTLYLYRMRLIQGSREKLSNLIILEEAHNLLLAKQTGTKESVLENSIRMIRQYGLGYVFVDQSASMLSKVAFANSYATIALSQKLRNDVQAMSGAMNLTDEQKEALNTLAIGTAVVRLADEHPEPFLIKIPRCPIQEGSVTDDAIRTRMAAYPTQSSLNSTSPGMPQAVPAVPPADKINENIKMKNPHPPSPRESPMIPSMPVSSCDSRPPPRHELSREETRFLADVAANPLSTTVHRYRRLNLSRRRGNAIRMALAAGGIIEAVAIATRSGQVVLYQLTDFGRTACASAGIDPGPRPAASLEHRYWVGKAAEHFERKGYAVTREHVIDGNGAVDILAERPGERAAVEVETGRSDIEMNLSKVTGAGFDRVVLVATCPAAVGACQKALDSVDRTATPTTELLTWLDLS